MGWICRENMYTCRVTRGGIWLGMGGFVDPARHRSSGSGPGFEARMDNCGLHQPT